MIGLKKVDKSIGCDTLHEIVADMEGSILKPTIGSAPFFLLLKGRLHKTNCPARKDLGGGNIKKSFSNSMVYKADG